MKVCSSLVVSLLVVGCAHTEPRPETPATPEREVIAVAEPPAPIEEPVVRTPPRLSRTITLGQGTSDAQYTGPSAPPPRAPEGHAQPNVIVNNTIVQSPPVFGWGSGYGYSRSYGRGFGHGESFGRGTSTWGTTGWEGARRTAAPGATPGVGGNWAPPPSFGPAPMR